MTIINRSKNIGVLALQGAFELHRPHIEALGCQYIPVEKPEDLKLIDGLILPGGESGVMLKLIEALNFKFQLEQFLLNKPAWGICAGAILLAKQVTNPSQFSFGAIDITIERNAYGRQLESSKKKIEGYDVSFIRAPKIVSVGKEVKVCFEMEGDPVWVENKKNMVTTFHPETNLNFPSPWHQRFCNLY